MKNNNVEEKCIGDGPPAQLFQSFYHNIHQSAYMAICEVSYLNLVLAYSTSRTGWDTKEI